MCFLYRVAARSYTHTHTHRGIQELTLRILICTTLVQQMYSLIVLADLLIILCICLYIFCRFILILILCACVFLHTLVFSIIPTQYVR